MSLFHVASGAPQPPRRRISVEEYLAAETGADTRNEYLDGTVRTMPGASRAHVSVVSSLGELVGSELRRRGPCRFMVLDVQIWIPKRNSIVYPDGAIACPPQYADRPTAVLLNPKVVFEALSPSTEAYDRGDKFLNYRSLETLEEYVLVSTTKPLVEVFNRSREWGVRTYEGLDAVARFEAIDLELPLKELYADVEWTG